MKKGLLDLPFTLNLPLGWRTRRRTRPCTSQPLTMPCSSDSWGCSYPWGLHLRQSDRHTFVLCHQARCLRRQIEAVLNEPLDKIASAPLRQPRGLFSFWELHENLKDKVNPYCRCRELFYPFGTLRTFLLVILHRTNSINLDCFLKSVSWKIDFPP